MRIRVLIPVVVGVAVLAGALLLRQAAEPAAEGPTVTARRGPFVIAVESEGELQAVESRLISRPRTNFWSPVQVVDLAPEGAVVQKGDFLVQLDTGEAERQLEQARNALLNAEAELASTVASNESREAELQSALLKQQYAHEQAQLRYDQMEYEAEVRRREQEIELKKAELALQEAKDRIGSQKVVAEAEEQKARLKVRQARQEVENSEKTVQAMTITAPEPGLVVYRKFRGDKIKVGDSTWPGMELIELPDLSKMKVRTRVNEVDVQRVEVGQPVEIQVDALPDTTFTGEISHLATLARLEEGAKVKTFDVDVAIQGGGGPLRPGMTARCRILTARYQDVVTVPLDAVFEEKGRTWVRRADGSEQDVVLGARNRDHVIVTEGLEAGDRVRLRLLELPAPDEGGAS